MADNNSNSTTEVRETGEVQPRTRLVDLRQKEKYWIWKASLRAIICVLGIIAIGCAAKLIAFRLDSEDNPTTFRYSPFPGASVGALIALLISFFWCILSIFIPFVLKPVRPIHPGVAVGLDLCLWIIFVFVALLSVTGVLQILYFGSDPTYMPDSWASHSDNGLYYNGNYYLAPNNTWVYNITYVQDITTPEPIQPGDPNYPNITRDCTPYYDTCAEQDAAVNNLWHQKPTLEAVTLMLCAILWLDVLLHFTLFVWACVDTNARNLGKKARHEKKVADKIIKNLEEKGLIRVRDGEIVASESQGQGQGQAQIQTQSQGSDVIQPVRSQQEMTVRYQ